MKKLISIIVVAVSAVSTFAQNCLNDYKISDGLVIHISKTQTRFSDAAEVPGYYLINIWGHTPWWGWTAALPRQALFVTTRLEKMTFGGTLLVSTSEHWLEPGEHIGTYYQVEKCGYFANVSCAVRAYSTLPPVGRMVDYAIAHLTNVGN